MTKLTYELVLVIEVDDEGEGLNAVNAAWYAANGTKTGSRRRRVRTETVRERRADGSIGDAPLG